MPHTIAPHRATTSHPWSPSDFCILLAKLSNTYVCMAPLAFSHHSRQHVPSLLRLELRRKRGKNRTERAGSIPNIRSPEKKKLQKRGTLRKSKSAPICVTISRPAYDNPSANLDVEELVPLTRQQLLVAQAAAENMVS